MATFEQCQQVQEFLGLADLELLETAYYHKYGVRCFLQDDLVDLRVSHIVPDYASQYINTLYDEMGHMYD